MTSLNSATGEERTNPHRAPASTIFFVMRVSLRKRKRRLASVRETIRSKILCSAINAWATSCPPYPNNR